MGANSKIEWTTHTFNPCSLGWRLRVSPQACAVREGVAAHAQGDPIPHIEAEVRELSERPNVVGIEIAAGVVAAVRAGKLVAPKNVIPPALEVRGRSQPTTLDALAVDVPGRGLPARRSLTSNRTDLSLSLGGVLLASPAVRTALPRGTHRLARRDRMRPPLERRLSPLGRLRLRNSAASYAPSGQAIEARSVAGELAHLPPILACSASLKSSGETAAVFIDAKAALACGNFLGSCGGLRHGHH
ncbi:MAG TPA: hypothetical protein VM434_12235 [Beijerinckiaceae bacterium]|nr:hypothetical protein [Beijerinckiaceae bacterium]